MKLLRLTWLVLLLTFSVNADEAVHRYLYCSSPDGAQVKSGSGTGLVIFDIDNGFKFVKRIDIPIFASGIRGLTGNLASHALY